MGVIYLATNKINGKQYVGLSSTTMIARQKDHKRGALKQGSTLYFHKAIRKYGWCNFVWEVVEYDVPDELLNQREIETIKRLGTRKPNGYNLTDGGDGLRNPTEEVRAKMRASHLGQKQSEETKRKRKESLKKAQQTPEYWLNQAAGRAKKNHAEIYTDGWRLKISQACLGHPVSEETRAKISKALKGKEPSNKGKPLSPEIKKKISESKKGKPQTLESNAKRSQTLKGRYFSPEHRARISAALRGRPLSPEHRQKLKEREARKREKRKTGTLSG